MMINHDFISLSKLESLIVRRGKLLYKLMLSMPNDKCISIRDWEFRTVSCGSEFLYIEHSGITHRLNVEEEVLEYWLNDTKGGIFLRDVFDRMDEAITLLRKKQFLPEDEGLKEEIVSLFFAKGKPLGDFDIEGGRISVGPYIGDSYAFEVRHFSLELGGYFVIKDGVFQFSLDEEGDCWDKKSMKIVRDFLKSFEKSLDGKKVTIDGRSYTLKDDND